MQFYSHFTPARLGQIVSDVVAVVAIGFFIASGIAAGAFIGTLAALGQSIEAAGSGFEGTMADAAESLGAIPFIGEGASSPFSSASAAGATLATAGRQQQDLVGNIALGVGLAVAVLPIALILLVWLRPRLRFVRRAGSVRSLAASPAGVELLALRALVGQNPSVLMAVGDDPVAAWRRGEPPTIRALAAVELKSAGVDHQRFG